MKQKDSPSMDAMQRTYWDGISAKYQKVMNISLVDFHYGPQIPGEKHLHLLPELHKGMRALELGCGGGQNSIWLAKHGATCEAFDISAEQLAHARALAKKEGVKISFTKGELDKWPSKFKGPYDLIHSSHAMEFANNPAQVITKAANLLSPGGTLIISTVHPLYNGDWVESFDEGGNIDGMGLFLRNYFSPPDDIRKKRGKIEVLSRAYPVSSWFRWMRQAGLIVTAIEEPPELHVTLEDGTEEIPPYTNPDWANNEGELAVIPGTLIISAVKP